MIGLPRCIPYAAAQIATYSTTFEPLDAAMEAVSWAVMARDGVK